MKPIIDCPTLTSMTGNETNPDVLGIRRVVVFTGDGGATKSGIVFQTIPILSSTNLLCVNPTVRIVCLLTPIFAQACPSWKEYSM